MANEKNLVPLNQRTKGEQRRIASAGGKASGEARRAKKTMREYADFLLSLPVSDRRKWNKLSRAGVPPEGCDNKMLVTFALMQAAQSGDVQAVKELRNLIGEDSAQAPEAESRIDEYLSALEDTVKNESK
jgi:hypothetical protein